MQNLISRKCRLLFSSLFIFIIGFSVNLNAEIYRWVDKDGKTHISDKAPDNDIDEVQTIEAKDIKINAVSEEESTRLGRQRYLENTSADQQQANAEQETQSKEAEKIKAECKQMKLALNKLNGGARLFSTDENGERTYVDDESRDKGNSELSSLYNEKCQSYQGTAE